MCLRARRAFAPPPAARPPSPAGAAAPCSACCGRCPRLSRTRYRSAWRRRSCARAPGRLSSSALKTGSPKPISGSSPILAREHAQRLEARHRRQHAHGMTLEQPGGVAIGREIARRIHLRHGNGRLLRHQQMERQRGERARRHHDEMTLVPDQPLDRTDQRFVKLVREAEVEQLSPALRRGALRPRQPAPSCASSHSFATTRPHSMRDSPRLSASACVHSSPLQPARQRIHIEPAPERRHLLCQRLPAERNCLPLEPFPRQRKDVGFPMLLGAEPEHQSFITRRAIVAAPRP